MGTEDLQTGVDSGLLRQNFENVVSEVIAKHPFAAILRLEDRKEFGVLCAKAGFNFALNIYMTAVLQDRHPCD